MSEKRQHKRHRRRLNVKFGDKQLLSNGFSMDLSQGGMFLVTSQLPALQSRIHVQVFLDSESHVFFEGEVRRHKMVPPELRSVERNGVGIRFLSPAEVVRGVMGLAGGARLPLHFASAAALQATFERELKHGGVFIATSTPPARDTKVTLDVNFEFARRTLEVEGTVVHTSLTEPVGVGVVFTDRSVVATFLGYLPR